MSNRRPIFTVISMLVAIVFAVGSRPLLIYSIDRQLADANLNSPDAVEDSGRMAGFALIAGQVMCGGIGAAVGVILAAIGFWRKERWRGVRWCSLILNLAAAGLMVFSFYPLWRSQHDRTATQAERNECGQRTEWNLSCQPRPLLDVA